jgi:type II secretory pathway component PulK
MIAVLVVVAILALAAYRLSDLMIGEQQAADSYTRAMQARANADSGIHYAAAILAAQNTQTNYSDNPSLFQDILVQDGDNARQRGRFSIVAPVGPDAASTGGVNNSFLYGVTDEGGKININALMKLDSSGTILYNVLMQLPNMTDAIANSIVFWIDPKATQRSSGATDEYYMSLNPPYHAKNAPLDNTEELLFVQGVTPQLLFGNDRNRNGILDPDEDDGSGALDMGWSAYLTSYSRESNVDSSGNPRIYINDPNLQSLQTYLTNAGFDDTISSFILAARMYGLTSSGSGGSGTGGSGTGGSGTGGSGTGGSGATGGGMSSGGTGAKPTGTATVTTATVTVKDDGTTTTTVTSQTTVSKSALTRGTLGSMSGSGGGSGGSGGSGGGSTISSLYSLVNAQVTIPGSNGQAGTTYNSPMSDSGSIQQYLPMILDKLTTKKSAYLPGRINVNTAPSAVLSALAPNGTPLLDSGTVQTIMATRPSTTSTDSPDPIYATPAWLITQANMPIATLTSLDQYITTHSQVFRVQSLGHFDAGGPTVRVEAVIDTNAGRPRIIYYRDLTGLGKGFNLPTSQN